MSQETSVPANRRAHRRARAKSLAAHLETSAGTLSGNVEDLSLGGLFVRTDRPLPLSTPVAVHLARPGMKRSLTLPGTVANARSPKDALAAGGSPGLGISFGAMGPLETARLVELIRTFAAPPPSEPPPVASPALAATGPVIGDTQRLLTQMRGLMLEMDELRQRLDEQERTIGELVEENARLTDELQAKNDLVARLRELLG